MFFQPSFTKKLYECITNRRKVDSFAEKSVDKSLNVYFFIDDVLPTHTDAIVFIKKRNKTSRIENSA